MKTITNGSFVRFRHFGFWFFLVSFVVIFAGFLLLENITNQLCCADDASFAVVSKNLADGLGYAMTLNYQGANFAAQLFPPALGTGPVTILTSAAFIEIFGAHAWVPGLSTVLLCSLYMLLIGAQLRHIVGGFNALLGGVVFVVLALGLSAYDFHYWSAELGEGPAALAVLAGYVFWVNAEEHHRNAVYAGLLLCLAYLTKELSAIYIVVLLAWIAGTWGVSLARGKPAGTLRRRVLLLCVGLAVPLVAFELYRVISLGSLHAYFENWAAHIAFVRSQGLGGSANHPMTAALAHFRALQIRYGTPALFVLFGVAVVVWEFLRERATARKLIGLLAVGIVVHMVYWTFFSIGWPRYAFTVIVLCAFLLAFGIRLRRPEGWLILAGCCVAFYFALLPRTAYIRDNIRAGLHQSPPNVQAAQNVVHYIVVNDIKSPIYTGWWADVADLEFLSKKPGMFSGYELAPKRSVGTQFYLITNSRFPLMYKDFVALVSACRIRYEASPYVVYACTHHGG